MRKPKVEKTRNAGTMTEAAYFAKIRSILRNGFRYWKPAMLAAEKASRPYKGENKRLKKEYQCKSCKEWFKRADVQIDHILPCGSLNNYNDIVDFIKRLTVENTKAFQVLCKPCHKEKTNNEKQLRNA